MQTPETPPQRRSATPKFILVDQSIVNLAGHYLEYATHVLEAAQRAGYEPFLATHKRFARHSRHSPWRTLAIYRYGYWAAKDASRGGLLSWLCGNLGWLRFRWRLFYHYSLFGLLWAVRDRFGEFLLRQPLDRTQLASLATMVPAAVLLKATRFLFLLALLPLAVAIFLLRSAARLLRAGGFPQGYVHSLLAEPADLWRFLRRLWLERGRYLRWWGEYRALRSFQRDTVRLLRETGAGAGDIVFLPTVSAIEFMGLCEALRGVPAGPSWRLLFRRDIFRGRPATYGSQDWRAAGLRQSLLAGKPKLAAHDVRFYTDTQELTAQYDRLAVFSFETAPIPHTHAPRRAKVDTARPLRIIYLGDARAEKGYQYLPRLVEDLWSRFVAPGKVTFHLQSNFNVPGGEPEAVVAREQLELLARRAPGSIQLFREPLSSEQYRELLLSGDINLLLYDPGNYYARSSGILVESLAAAIPVVAPANTWLSRQFADAATAWRWSLDQRAAVVRELGGDKLRWQGQQDGRRLPLSALGGSGPICTLVRVPLGAAPGRLLIRLACATGRSREVELVVDTLDAKGQSGGAQRRTVELTADGRLAELWSVPSGTAQIWLGLADKTFELEMREIKLSFLAPGDDPTAAVSLSYYEPAAIAGAVSELITHHAHYRATAEAFAGTWRRFHNAEQLVAQLSQARKAQSAQP